MATWIKTWSEIADAEQYLVLQWDLNKDFSESFTRPKIMQGWEVKQLLQGLYIAQRLRLPHSKKECL